MADEGASNFSEILSGISQALARHGDTALADGSAEQATAEWLAAGFDDAEEVEEWLNARCFRAVVAQALERAGITPEQASLRTTAGAADYCDTIAYKIARRDLSIDEARRIITSEFWS